MKKKEINFVNKYLFVGVIVLFLYLTYKIVSPYLVTLISAFVLAYLIRPVYKRLLKKFPKRVSAFICLALIVLIVIIPLTFLAGGIINQALYISKSVEIQNTLSKVSDNYLFNSLNIDVDRIVNTFSNFLVGFLKSAISFLPSLAIAIVILLLGIYYMLIDWEILLKELKKYLPVKDKEKITIEISKSTDSIVRGSVLIAAIEFVIAFIGFLVSGVGLYLLLPAIVFFMAFIPGIGPAVVWIPITLYYLFTGSWFTAIGVLITGFILSVYIDTILRSRILGGGLKVNPLIMLIGILGGIGVFGVFGFIIGPLILIYTLKLTKKIIE